MIKLARTMLFLPVALLLAACVTGGDRLPPTVVDHTFEKISVNFYNSLGTPETVTYYLKVFDRDGMLAVCGVSVLLGKGVMDQLMDRWLDEAAVAVRNADNKIVSARFIGQTEERREPKPANCVKTETPATAELLRARARLVGIEVYYQ